MRSTFALFPVLQLIGLVLWENPGRYFMIGSSFWDLFGALSCGFWSIAQQCGAQLPTHTLNYRTDSLRYELHFSSSQKCQASSQKNPEWTTAISSSSSYCRCWWTSRDLRPFARSILIDLLGITILLCLSQSKLGMAIYLINEMAFPPLTSNNTKWCAHLIYPSDQLSSPMDSSLSHLPRQQVTTVPLFQLSWAYKQATLDPVKSVSPLLLPQQQLLLSKSSSHHCLRLLDVPCPDMKTLFLRFLPCLPRGLKLACSVPEAPDVPTKRPQVASPACSCFRHNFTSPLWCSFLLLRAWTAIWYHIPHSGLGILVAWFWLLSVVQVPALVS